MLFPNATKIMALMRLIIVKNEQRYVQQQKNWECDGSGRVGKTHREMIDISTEGD